MIRLIASDLDGTLLDSRKNLPPGFFDMVRRLRDEKNIRFMAASGRQYYNVLRIFEPVADEILFLCENGGVVFEKGKCLYSYAMPVEKLRLLLKTASPLKRTFPAVCGVKAGYIMHDDPEFLRNVRMYFDRWEFVGSWEEAFARDQICKVALYDLDDPEKITAPALQCLKDQLQIVVSSTHWVDVMDPGLNKGRTFRAMMKQWDLSPDECMAFGDYQNDLEMLQSCRFGYAMANGHPDVVRAAPLLAPSNDEDGVMRVLRNLF